MTAENEVTITGRGKYRLIVVEHGGVKPEQVTTGDATIDPNDHVRDNGGGNWALTGSVNNGTDSYRFVGALHENSSADGGVDVSVAEGSNDHDEPSRNVIQDIDKSEAIGGGAFHDVGEQEPRDGLVSRFETTTQDRTIEVSASDGGGVQHALNRLPHRIQHEIVLELGAGVHQQNGPSCRTGQISVSSRGRLFIDGQGMDETRVKGGMNSTSGVTKQEHYKVRNIHFDGMSQFAGPVDVRDCRFTDSTDRGKGTAAISGKNGQVFMKRCVIGRPEDQYSIFPTLMEWYVLVGCELHASKGAVRSTTGPQFNFDRCDFSGVPSKFA